MRFVGGDSIPAARVGAGITPAISTWLLWVADMEESDFVETAVVPPDLPSVGELQTLSATITNNSTTTGDIEPHD